MFFSRPVVPPNPVAPARAFFAAGFNGWTMVMHEISDGSGKICTGYNAANAAKKQAEIPSGRTKKEGGADAPDRHDLSQKETAAPE